jgi:hypothetical protein
MKMGKTLHPTPYTPHPAPGKNFFSRPYLRRSSTMTREYMHEYLKELIVEKALHLCCDPIEEIAQEWAEKKDFNQGGINILKDPHRYEKYLEEAKEVADEFRKHHSVFTRN